MTPTRARRARGATHSSDEQRGIYKKLVVSEHGSRLLGAILVGDSSEYGSCLQMMQNALKLPEHPEELILPARGATPSPAVGLDALPGSAQICSCNNVNKATICAPRSKTAAPRSAPPEAHTRGEFLVRRLRAAGDAIC